MSAAGTAQRSPSRPSLDPLVLAFAISLGTHLVVYGGYELGHRLGWWQKAELPAWLQKVAQAFASQKPVQKHPDIQQEIPLEFVEVDPSLATPEAPKNATHYSALNSKAANPDAQVETEKPKLDGSQTHVPKTETVPRSKAVPLQPAPPPKPAPEEQATEAKPKGGQEVGDLAMAKPRPQDQKAVGEADAAVETRPRSRTLAEAQSRALPGEMMKQDGGVKKRQVATSLDTIGTPFGAYDGEIVAAITQHWYDLVDKQNFTRDRSGRVVLEFRLNFDGRVTDMKVIENTVDDLLEYLCERAIRDPAPYRPWPSDLRRLMGADYRDVRFTFYYD